MCRYSNNVKAQCVTDFLHTEYLKVGCSHDNDTFVGIKAVHLCEQLVQRLASVVFPLLAAAAHRINLVDEDNAGGLLLGSCKEAAHSAGAHPDKHLLKLAACPAIHHSSFKAACWVSLLGEKLPAALPNRRPQLW